MSFEIGPEAGMAAGAPAPGDRASGPGGGALGNPRSGALGGAGAEAIPAIPPREVRAAMGIAARAYEDLKDNGREVRFKVDRTTDRLRIEVRDARGNLLYTVPPSKVLDVACGEPLP